MSRPLPLGLLTFALLSAIALPAGAQSVSFGSCLAPRGQEAQYAARLGRMAERTAERAAEHRAKADYASGEAKIAHLRAAEQWTAACKVAAQLSPTWTGSLAPVEPAAEDAKRARSASGIASQIERGARNDDMRAEAIGYREMEWGFSCHAQGYGTSIRSSAVPSGIATIDGNFCEARIERLRAEAKRASPGSVAAVLLSAGTIFGAHVRGGGGGGERECEEAHERRGRAGIDAVGLIGALILIQQITQPQLVGDPPKTEPKVAGGSTVDGGKTTPPTSPPPQDQPRSGFATAPENKVCGPDVTTKVMDVLDKIMRNFRQASAEKQAAACSEAMGPLSGINAWDIVQLSPAVAPQKGETPDQIAKNKYWLEPYGLESGCCTPRVPCGDSVQFLGHCLHAQVVNYAMWGVISKLCNNTGGAAVRHWAYATVKSIRGNPPYEEQQAMAEFGQHYYYNYQARLTDPPTKGPSSGFGASPDKKVEKPADRTHDFNSLKPGLDAALKKAIYWPEMECSLSCKLNERQAKMFGFLEFDFVWPGLREPPQDWVERAKNIVGK